MKNTSRVGIDWSMTSPGICVYKDGVYHHYFFHLTKKPYTLPDIQGHKFHQYPYPQHSSNIDRFLKLADWALHIIPEDSFITMEGYSMGSRAGMAFNIGENGGILKAKLWERGQSVLDVPPSTLKKSATGKGNATKNKMYEAWMTKTEEDIANILTPNKTGISSPVEDIVDAYFLVLYHQETITVLTTS